MILNVVYDMIYHELRIINNFFYHVELTLLDDFEFVLLQLIKSSSEAGDRAGGRSEMNLRLEFKHY